MFSGALLIFLTFYFVGQGCCLTHTLSVVHSAYFSGFRIVIFVIYLVRAQNQLSGNGNESKIELFH